MGTHLLRLLGRALYATPHLLSSNWFAAIFSAGIFAITQLLLFLFLGREYMKSQWRNITIGLYAILGSWLLLYAISIVNTVYEDHIDLVARNAALRVDNKILTDKNKDQCWVSSQFAFPNSKVKGAKSATQAIIRCNFKIDAPYLVRVEFDRDFIPGAIAVLDAPVVMGGVGGKQGNTYEAQVSSPSLLSNQLVIVNVYGKTDQYPQVVKGSIQPLK